MCSRPVNIQCCERSVAGHSRLRRIARQPILERVVEVPVLATSTALGNQQRHREDGCFDAHLCEEVVAIETVIGWGVLR